MRKVIVLGVGRVGQAIAQDLARDDTLVTAADLSRDALAQVQDPIRRVEADLTDLARIMQLTAEHDLAVLALPGHSGFAALEAIIESRTPVVDISFSERDPFALDSLAQAKGVPAIVDAGVAPGLSNLLLGHVMADFDQVEAFGCYVGGLPAEPVEPFRYRAPFSPVDVIEEYTRPARYREAGTILTVPALSQLETLHLPGVGTLEAFLTDGLRTLLRLEQIPTMWEKTLRYRGHAKLMGAIRDLGLFDATPIEVKGMEVVPRNLTAQLLFPHWEYPPGETDLTIMRVVIDTVRDHQRQRHTFDLLDRFDHESGTSSMARTTGYTCTAAARLVLRGDYTTPGIAPLEVVGSDPRCYSAMMRDLEARKIVISHTTSIPD